LVIVGAGGFARETAQAARGSATSSEGWEVIGFVDDDPALEGKVISGVEVLGPVESVRDRDAFVVVCTGRPDNYFSRKRIVRRLGLSADRYATIVHPSCVLASNTKIGIGSVLLANVVATSDVVIGDHVAVMPQVVLTHDDRIGDYATLASGARLGGGAVVEEGAYIGAGAMLRQGVKVGRWALVGMGAIALRDVPAAEVWAGVPARRFRRLEVPGDL
jgi:sugar O-acyltransferase (sialic acid O-acetyltransferase NeuD family)